MAKKDRGPGVSRLPQFNEFSASGRRAAKIEESGLDLSKINEGFKRAILQHAFIKAGGEGMFDISTFEFLDRFLEAVQKIFLICLNPSMHETLCSAFFALSCGF